MEPSFHVKTIIIDNVTDDRALEAALEKEKSFLSGGVGEWRLVTCHPNAYHTTWLTVWQNIRPD